MKQYHITYPVSLRTPSRGFCVSPLDIMRQMEAAQEATLRKIEDFIAREKLQGEMLRLEPVEGKIGIRITCSDNVAKKLARQRFVERIEEHVEPMSPPAAIKPFKFNPKR